MKTKSIALLSAMIFLFPVTLSGCWNYIEIDQMAVVGGVAIDKGISDRVRITVEIAEVGHGGESEQMPKVLTMEGKTVFDAVRNTISVLGKKLYWSHCKVVILSNKFAEDGVLEVIDWFERDAETRADSHILVSKAPTAGEILTSKPTTEKLVSYEIDKSFDSQVSLHHVPDIEIWKFSDDMLSEGINAVTASVDLRQFHGEKRPVIDGAAIFRGDRLVGFIDGKEAMSMLFIQDEIKGGVLVLEEIQNGDDSKGIEASLEITNNKTKVKPVIRDGTIEIDVSIYTETAIDELGTSEDLISNPGRERLEVSAEETLKSNVERIIMKAQKVYDADMFGFGEKLRKENPKAWSSVEKDWGNIFKELKINVKSDIHIKNSAMLSKPLEVK